MDDSHFIEDRHLSIDVHLIFRVRGQNSHLFDEARLILVLKQSCNLALINLISLPVNSMIQLEMKIKRQTIFGDEGGVITKLYFRLSRCNFHLKAITACPFVSVLSKGIKVNVRVAN